MPRPTTPPTRKLVSDFLKSVIGEQATTFAYYDERERHVVGVTSAAGSPHPELEVFSTCSLHVVPNLLDGTDVRVELLVVGERGQEDLANVVATSAFQVMKDGWLAAPGVVFPDAVSEYVPRATTPHLMWDAPFAYQELSVVELDGVGTPIHWLQGVPLTDAEWTHLKEHGYDSLAARLEAADAPVHDVFRASVV